MKSVYACQIYSPVNMYFIQHFSLSQEKVPWMKDKLKWYACEQGNIYLNQQMKNIISLKVNRMQLHEEFFCGVHR